MPVTAADTSMSVSTSRSHNNLTTQAGFKSQLQLEPRGTLGYAAPEMLQPQLVAAAPGLAPSATVTVSPKVDVYRYYFSNLNLKCVWPQCEQWQVTVVGKA
jgi:hypothetical protein